MKRTPNGRNYLLDIVPTDRRQLLLNIHAAATVHLLRGLTPAQALAHLDKEAPGWLTSLPSCVFADIERFAEFLSVEPSGTIH